MTDNVTPFPGHRVPTPAGTPDPVLIKLLEDALERARSGEYAALAFAAIHADGCFGTAFQISSQPQATDLNLLGAVNVLHKRLLESF